MTFDHIFLEPLDVLYLRGNRVFGDAGDHGEAVMPPWPSLVAGALRSRMLTDSGATPDDLRNGTLPAPWDAVLGSAAEPGSFRLSGLALGRRGQDGNIEACYPCPADLFVTGVGGEASATYLRPAVADRRLASSYPLPYIPALTAPPGKTVARWLTGAGWQAYRAGQPITSAHLLMPQELWKTDARVGVALDPSARAAAKSKLVSSDTVAFRRGVGLLAAVSGAQAKAPKTGVVRLGGDGRGARLQSAPAPPAPDYAVLAKAGRVRLILSSPGIFESGWRLPAPWQEHVVCAAVPRHGVISGWDLANWRAKPAQRVAPVGSVYWLDGLRCSAAELEAAAQEGLWGANPDRARRAEGYNAVTFADWKD